MPGVEIHASIFETLAQGRFLRRAGDLDAVLVSAALVLLAGGAFLWLTGAPAYLAGGAILIIAHALPYALYRQDLVFPFMAPVLAAWFSVAGASGYQHFAARRRLRRAEAEKARYQQAVHFVTHEMRTPLTAIQGSSELMSRYNLGEDKRKQIAGLIYSESKRLAKMVETFLNVEKLSAGQMELKSEKVPVAELVEACVARVRPLAERKDIRVVAECGAELAVLGDRELLEYALYNLLTNAIKYSPAGSEVTVHAAPANGSVRLSVKDQGIGMDEKEMKGLFRKFYRTERAVASGESGMGIGLSIVREIVLHHRGEVQVASAPGKGSCFTLVFPAQPGRDGPAL
jgi:signal transduction histidine kinase